MKLALVIERCHKCPWYSEMRGCMHNEGPVGIVENDYIINPECPLPDYVDVEKLKETIKELGSLVAEGQKTYSEKIAQLTMVEHDLRVMQKERDELAKALEGLIKVAKVAKNHEYQYMNQAVEALAKIKGGCMSTNEEKLIDRCVKLQSDKAELLAMLIEVRGDYHVRIDWEYQYGMNASALATKVKIGRLDALIERMKT